jgi:uncharacterized repeat protein (TIGR03803 family)
MRNLTKCSQAAALLASALCTSLFAQPAGPKLSTIYSFAGSPDGAYPIGNLAMDTGGNLYSATQEGGVWANGSVVQLKSSGSTWTESVLYSFTGGADGGYPDGALTLDGKGNVYGTTLVGGNGCGVVFELTSSGGTWSENPIYTFTCGPDGTAPNGGLVFDASGNLYGTTGNGGPVNAACGGYGTDIPAGCGVVFQLAPPASGTTWTENVLYSFTGGADGAQPGAGVIFDTKGNLYGTTSWGGPSSSLTACPSPAIGAPAGCGVIFKLIPPASGSAWTETSLYTFTGASDGLYPDAGLAFDTKGNLYGSTEYSNEKTGDPTTYGPSLIFQLAKPAKGQTAWTYTVLDSMVAKNGANPYGTLMLNKNGTIYGTAWGGGKKRAGVIFQLRPPKKGATKWVETVLYNFLGKADGTNPKSGVLLNGTTMFGTTTGAGGPASSGTVFELTL